MRWGKVKKPPAETGGFPYIWLQQHHQPERAAVVVPLKAAPAARQGACDFFADPSSQHLYGVGKLPLLQQTFPRQELGGLIGERAGMLGDHLARFFKMLQKAQIAFLGSGHMGPRGRRCRERLCPHVHLGEVRHGVGHAALRQLLVASADAPQK